MLYGIIVHIIHSNTFIMAIKRILIPTDFSETAQMAIAHGGYMAKLFKAKIYLMHSIESAVYGGLPVEMVPILEEEHPDQLTEQKLNHLADGIVNKYNVEIDTVTIAGIPVRGIEKAVMDNNIDLIVMGTHGANGFEEYFLGSNTLKVVNNAPCPVISVQMFAKRVGFSNIIMPIDNDLHSRQKVNNVIELAKVYKSTVHILGLLETDDVVDEKKFEIKLNTVEHVIKHSNIT